MESTENRGRRYARRQVYYFGRVNLTANYSNKKEYLSQVFATTRKITYRQYGWRFSDVELNEHEGHFLFSGFLAKVLDTSHEVVDDSSPNIGEILTPNEVIAKSRFLLDVRTGIVAYHQVQGHISPRGFLDRFAEVFRNWNPEDRSLSVSIETIVTQESFRTMLEGFRKINSITLKLHPSNPSSREPWRSYDERFQILNITEYTETYKTGPLDTGISIDQEINDKIQMAEDGYGNATAKGETDSGRNKTITLRGSHQVSELLPSGLDTARELTDGIWTYFKSLLARFIDNP